MTFEDLINGIVQNSREKFEKEADLRKNYYSQSGENAFSAFFDVGARGEFLSYKMISEFAPENMCIANCYIPKGDGTTAEIDIIMVHPTGVYVFESKNYSGYIFGSLNQKMWTQTLHTGYGRVKKNYFFNPVMQNKSHIRYLERYIGNDIPFYSYIVFSERCELMKMEYDSDVRIIQRYDLRGCLKQDTNIRPIRLSEERMHEIYIKLDEVSHASKEKKVEHVFDIYEKKVKAENDICPRCGGKLVLRTAKKGANAGNNFKGCSNYPNCKFTKNINN